MSGSWVSSQRQIPNLLLSAGAMKAGTTWLYNVLKEHPQILSSPVKEIHFFARNCAHWDVLSRNDRVNRFKEYASWQNSESEVESLVYDLNWFRQYLVDPVDDTWFANLFPARSSHNYCTDFSNLTALLDGRQLRQIRESVENLRIIYTIRDPVQRYWSHINFHTSMTNPMFRLEDLSVESFRRILHTDDFKRHGQYSRFILSCRAHLDKSEFLLIKYEDLHHDRHKGIGEIESFLGLRHHGYSPDVLENIINPAPRRIRIPKNFVEACRPLLEQEYMRLDNLGINLRLF